MSIYQYNYILTYQTLDGIRTSTGNDCKISDRGLREKGKCNKKNEYNNCKGTQYVNEVRKKKEIV